MPPEAKDVDSWERQGTHVLSEITRCAGNIHGLRSDIQALSLQITEIRIGQIAMKTKTTMIWAILGGTGGSLVTVITALAVWFLTKGH